MPPWTKKKMLSLAKRMLPLIIGIAIITGFMVKLGPSRIIGLTAGANLYMVLLAGLLLVSAMALKSLRWHLLLKPLGSGNFRVSSYSYFLGQITNEILPTGSGEIVRIAVLKQWSAVRFMNVVPAILVERFLDVTLLLLLSIFLMTVFLNEIVIILLLGSLFASMLFILKPDIMKTIARYLSGFVSGKGLISRMFLLLMGKLIELSDSMLFYSRRRDVLFVGALITGVSWIGLECASQYVLAAGFGVYISPINMLGIVAISWILGTISMLPGGLGAREVVYALALSNAGVQFEIGLAIAMIYRSLVYILFALMAGIAYLQTKSNRPLSAVSL